MYHHLKSILFFFLQHCVFRFEEQGTEISFQLEIELKQQNSFEIK